MDNNNISSMIGTTFAPEEGKKVCWSLCRKVFEALDIEPPENVHDLKRVDEPSVGDIVLFAFGVEWHTGILWPDNLHFIHARPPLDSHLTGPHVIEKCRLTHPMYTNFVDGFFTARDSY